MGRPMYQLPSDQILDSATLSLGSNTTAVGYALENLYDSNPASPWVAGSTAAISILMDFGGSYSPAVKLVGFINHNFDAGEELYIQGNATNSWGAPTVSQQIFAPALRADGSRQDFFWLLTTQTTTLRWWRVASSGASSSAWRIGELWVSETANRTFPQLERQSRRDVRTEIVHETPTGVSLRYADEARQERLSLDVSALRALVLPLRDWHRACLGNARPTLFLLDPDDTAKECFFVTHEPGGGQLTHQEGRDTDVWTTTVILRTLSPGIAVP